MNILIQVFANEIYLRLGQGDLIRFYDWSHIIASEIIRDGDTVKIQNYTTIVW